MKRTIVEAEGPIPRIRGARNADIGPLPPDDIDTIGIAPNERPRRRRRFAIVNDLDAAGRRPFRCSCRYRLHDVILFPAERRRHICVVIAPMQHPGPCGRRTEHELEFGNGSTDGRAIRNRLKQIIGVADISVQRCALQHQRNRECPDTTQADEPNRFPHALIVVAVLSNRDQTASDTVIGVGLHA